MGVSGSSFPVVSLGELKAHLRVEDELEDALLAGWLRAATAAVEAELGVLLVEREVVEVLPVVRGEVRLSARPLCSVESVETAAGDDWLPLAGDAFRVDAGDDRGAVLAVDAAGAGEVRVRYRAGAAAGSNEVSGLVREAIIRLAAFWHGNRDNAEAPVFPSAIRAMLAPLRVRRLR